jgi:hypothetical protein
MLDSKHVNLGTNPPKNFNSIIEKAMKVHGTYTEGFHEEELERLFNNSLIPKVGNDGE